MLYDTIILMSIKAKKTIIYSAFVAMLVVAFYIIFFTQHLITNKYYRIITLISLAMAFGVFLLILIKNNTTTKNIKLVVGVCVLLVVFQTAAAPFANTFSQSLPLWPPRGTVYQYTGSNSISQNEVALMMRYYLNGKKLYANEDYPLNAHNGYIFITDEYEFIQGDYPVLSENESKEFLEENEDILITKVVQANPKLKIPSFNIYLTTQTSNEFVILTNENNSWFVIDRNLFREVFGE